MCADHDTSNSDQIHESADITTSSTVDTPITQIKPTNTTTIDTPISVYNDIQLTPNRKLRPINPLLPPPKPKKYGVKPSSTYKTELCTQFNIRGTCQYLNDCKFAHGIHELRERYYDPHYKTRMCVLYVNGYCSFGSRCQFLHDEYRIRKSTYEFWLISPSDGMTRVERVDPANVNRLKQLIQLCDNTHITTNYQTQQYMLQQQTQPLTTLQPDYNNAITALSTVNQYYNLPCIQSDASSTTNTDLSVSMLSSYSDATIYDQPIITEASHMTHYTDSSGNVITDSNVVLPHYQSYN